MKINSPEFNKLKESWYKKLKNRGFEDLENKHGLLKKYYSTYGVNRQTSASFQAKQDYFMMAGQFLHHHKFTTILEKSIWRYHSEGHPVREVVKRTRAWGVNVTASEIAKLIKKLQIIMVQEVNEERSKANE